MGFGSTWHANASGPVWMQTSRVPVSIPSASRSSWGTVICPLACIVTSAEKHLQNATRDAIKRFKDKGKQTGNFVNDATNGGIGASPIRNLNPIPAGLEDKLKQAIADMASGKLKPIP